jgi:hypothetical protein
VDRGADSAALDRSAARISVHTVQHQGAEIGLQWPLGTKNGGFALNTKIIGAPRSMKMGTIASPWRHDAAARHALRSANPRRPTILHYD